MMNRIHHIAHTNAEIAGGLDWADLGRRIREATDDAMAVAMSIPDSLTPTEVPTDEVIER